MDDAFLYRYRKRPRLEFAEALYQRIAPPPCVSLAIGSLRQMGRSLALMSMALLVMLLVSSEARDRVWRQVEPFM